MKNKILICYAMSPFLILSCSTKNITSETSIKQNEKFSNAIVENYNIASNTKNPEIKNNNLNFDLKTKNGSSFSVKFNFNKIKDFSTKANTNGNPGKVNTDINLLRVYLVNNNTSNLNGTNIKYGPFDIDINSTGTLATFFSNIKGLGKTGNLTFSNVGAGNYYVAIAAYSSATTINSTTNIIKSTTNITSGTNFGNFSLSNSGGDSPGLSGLVTVASMVVGGRAAYSLVNNGTANLGVTLNLINALGATIDATTTITQGSSTIPATSLQ